MLESAMNRLSNNTAITDFSAGSIARALLEVYYDDMEILHEKLVLSTAMSFLSSAKGPYLDEIGKLFNCDREANESDKNYSYRISKQTENLAKANEIAVRLACLSVEGVNDINIKKFIRGTGTFDVYLITDNPSTPNSILDNVQEKIKETQAVGVNGQVVKPKLVDIDMYIRYIFYNDIDISTKKEIKFKAEKEIREHIINKNLEPVLIINKIIDLLMSIDQDSIKNLQITKMFLDGKETTINDKEFYWDQRLVPQNISIK
jgi:hypothetical protein